jgi:hypothetical protein
MFRFFYKAIFRGCVTKLHIFKNTSMHWFTVKVVTSFYTVNQCIDVFLNICSFVTHPLKMAS